MKPLVIPYSINGQQRSPSLASGLFEPLVKASSFEMNTLPNVVGEMPGIAPPSRERVGQQAYLHVRTRSVSASHQTA